MMQSKKFLAILLTLCMLMSFVPFGAFASTASAEVVGQQLMLGDDLTMHFHVRVNNAANPVATLAVGDTVRNTYDLAQMTAGENGYDLPVSLGAPEMSDTIILTVSDGQTQLLEKSYSVVEYAKYLLEGNYTNETKALVKELLNYGAKSQLYFGHNTGNLANAGYEIETEAVIGNEIPALEVSDNLSGMAFYGASMVFESKIAVRFYFTAKNGVEGYTFAVEGKEITDGEKNGMYYIEVADINPDQMDNLLNVSVTKDGQSISFRYSPISYIIRMYNKESSASGLKEMLKAANGYFQAAKVFTGVAENRTGSLTLNYRYGAANLIQVNTNLPANTPCVNFTASDNGCNIDQSANLYQQFGWVGMDNVDGTIVLTFHFNGNFEAGQTYELPKGAVFGFTDGSKYALDKNYTFTFDGSAWSAEAKEPAMTLSYRYGTDKLIQFNTNLPASTPCVSFTASDNGCNIDQSANRYQQFGWAGMDNVDGTIVLTFHFNNAFNPGQNYILSSGSVFGFTDGSCYVLESDVNLYWDGASWGTEAPKVHFTYRYGTSNLIQINTDLPSDTPCVNFLLTDNGCSVDESANRYQNVAWVGMDNVDGTIVLTYHFNGNFEAGQDYTLPAGAIFGFTDGKLYHLDGDYTFAYDGASWRADVPGTEPEETEPEASEPEVTEPELAPVSFQYRYGTNNLIQVNTNLPATTPIANFLASDNGCNLLQSGDQQVGWIGMANADGTIVLTFNFNAAFAAGQSYTLDAGSVFGFTDGSSYALDGDYTFTFDGSNWSVAAPEPAVKEIAMTYRYGTDKLIQFNTNLPASTALKDFLASDNGCNILQGGDQQFGWASMILTDGVVVITLNFNGAFAAGQSYTLGAGSVFGFADGSVYTLPADVTLYWNGSGWTDQEPAKNISLSHRYGTDKQIQFNTNLPASTALKDFLASDNGCNILQGGDLQVGYISMLNVDGTIVLTFNFNGAFAAGQSYTLGAGSVFAFTDGSSYVLDQDYAFYWNGSSWGTEPIITMSYRWGNANTIQFNTNLPASTPIANFTADQNGCSIDQSGNTVQWVGWIGMDNVDGTIVLTFHFNKDFAYGESYTLAAGSVFGFTDGSSYQLDKTYTVYWDNANWGETVPEPEIPVDVLDENNFTGGDVITFADIPVDFTNADKIQEYKELGFNTSVITEDHIGSLGQGADGYYSVSLHEENAQENALNFQYRYGTNNLIQVNTNLPASTPVANFTADQNGCSIDQSGNTVQWVGWIGMDNVDGTIVLTFHFNNAFAVGQSYVLPKGAVFGFTDGSLYTLDGDYTFTWDGANWNLDASTLSFSLSAGAAKYIQLKTNIPTGLTYGDFLYGNPDSGHTIILETTEGAQSVAWFSYSELSGAVYLTFNFTAGNRNGTQYILKAGTSLKAGDRMYTTDRDYVLTVHNSYLSGIENLDNAGLNVWIRNFTNKTGYFNQDMTNILLQYKDIIDGFYMVDEAFQNSTLLEAAGQQEITTDIQTLAADTVEWFNTNFAGKYFHSNQVPVTSYDHYTGSNGETLSAMDVNGYKKFLEAYKSLFNAQLDTSNSSVGFDNYPFTHNQGFNLSSFKTLPGIEENYLLNCLLVAQAAGNYDFSLCIQTFEAADLKNKTKRDIKSAAEVSFQIYTGLAMGADVFEYFAYNSNGEFNAIMNQDGSKRIYDLVKEGNQALCFADVVNSFVWNGIVTSTGTKNSDNTAAFGKVENMVLTNISNGVLNGYSSTDDAIIGCFTKGDLNGYMVVNFNDPQEVTGNNTVTMSFENCTRARVYTQINGVLTSEIVELQNGTYEAILAPGSACFIIPA